MELHEFEIGQFGAGARGEREALAEEPPGLVLCRKSPPTPPVAMTTRPVANITAPPARREDAAHGAVFDDEAARARVPSITRDRRRARTASTSARMISRPVASPPAWTMRRRRMRGLQPQREARRRASRSKATPRRARSSIACGAARVMRSTAVGRRARRRRRACRRRAVPDVVRADARRRCRLAPSALDASAPSGALDNSSDRFAARGAAPPSARRAAADDERRRPSMSVMLRMASVQIASMRSTARRARPAIAGSIVTSCVHRLQRAADIGSVIRFICGQRLHGRTNSTSG